ncbi:MAG: AbrB/MazE/SpoVT family DNA-binding domain-containing protein [Acidimicrobiia bacterium]
MLVSIDRVGRLVIPKQLREALGIGPDTELEITPDGAGLRLEVVQRKERTIGSSDGLPILDAIRDMVITDDDIRRLRDDINR